MSSAKAKLDEALNEKFGPKLRDRVLTPGQCAAAPKRGYILKNIIAPGDVAAIVGSPGTGKSVAAPHIAYGIAQGRKVFGQRTRQGRVLYVAAEDPAGLKNRIAALCMKHGDTENFQVIDVTNLNDAGEAAELFEYIEEWKPALVVIDTVAAAWAGYEENGSSSNGMGAVVAFSRKISKTGAAVLLLHHPALNGNGGPRGHSSLNGTLDSCIILSKKEGETDVTMRMSKNRNGSPFIPMGFRIETVHLGIDGDGDSITAPIASETGAKAPATEKRTDDLSRGEQEAVAALRAAIDQKGVRQSSGVMAVDIDHWRQGFYAARVPSKDAKVPSKEASRRAFDRAVKDIPKKTSRVKVNKPWVWIDEDEFEALEDSVFSSQDFDLDTSEMAGTA